MIVNYLAKVKIDNEIQILCFSVEQEKFKKLSKAEVMLYLAGKFEGKDIFADSLEFDVVSVKD